MRATSLNESGSGFIRIAFHPGSGPAKKVTAGANVGHGTRAYDGTLVPGMVVHTLEYQESLRRSVYLLDSLSDESLIQRDVGLDAVRLDLAT